MIIYVLKVIATSILVVLVAELSKKSSLLGAVLASIPVVSVLAMIWLYHDTKDISKIISLSSNIFWLVIPSLALFLALPALLKTGLHFYLSLLVSIGLSVVCYLLAIKLLGGTGISS